MTQSPHGPDRSEEAFTEAAGPLRPELLAHCYRMLGSAAEAEDRVQDVYLRAWLAFHSFDGRSSVRTWMYRIATNTCLNALKSTGRRVLPTGLGQPAGDPDAGLVERRDLSWVEPLPERVLWQASAPTPEEAVVAREGIGLAFVAAVQHLPPRQRAALVLREVLEFSAAETAELLGTTVASVNSAVQRARATLGGVDADGPAELTDADERAIAGFVAAFESHDFGTVADVLASDLVWQMPPFDRWYLGPADAVRLSLAQCPAAGPGDLRFLRAAANGQPALGMYLRDPDAAGAAHRAFQFQVLSVADGRVDAVTGYFGDDVFRQAGLPLVLDA